MSVTALRPRNEGPTRDAIVAGGFVPVKDAASRLGLKPNAVYKLMHAGEIAFVRAAGRHAKAMRVSSVSLAHYIDRNLIVR